MKKKILFSLISLCLFFLLLELIFRVIFFVNYHKYHTTAYIQGGSLQMADRRLIFRNRPFYLDKKKRYQFNSEGFKSKAGDTEMPEKKAGDFWVFLFGGSAMEGMGSNKDGEWMDITGIPDYTYEASIVNLLQQQLQEKLQGRRVRVFCAANSGYAVYQSMLQYQRLRAKYKMDWVISMDGVNEPMLYEKDTSVRYFIQRDWNESPVYRFPLKYIIPITRNCVFINSLKQALFENKMSSRLKKARAGNFPVRAKWLAAETGPLLYGGDTVTVRRSVDSFFYYMKLFDQQLTSDKVPHLLFVQPHLILRDTLRMTGMEKALLHYYASAGHNNPTFNQYIKAIHDTKNLSLLPGSIRELNFMHRNNFETFVDYCHFSPVAMKELAVYFAACIVAGQQ